MKASLNATKVVVAFLIFATSTMSFAASGENFAALVPEDWRTKDVIVASVNPDVAPIKFLDESGNIAGLVPDLYLAAGELLGLNVTMEHGSFDAMIPGLTSGRFDIILSMGDTVSRQQHVTFVDIIIGGMSVVVSPASDIVVADVDTDLCGYSVAVTRGSRQQIDLENISELCVAAGNEPPETVVYNDINASLLSIPANNADMAWIDGPPAAYNAAKSPENFKVIHTKLGAPAGMGFLKGQEEIASAFQAAFRQLVETGEYDEITARWGFTDHPGLLPEFPINYAAKLDIQK